LLSVSKNFESLHSKYKLKKRENGQNVYNLESELEKITMMYEVAE